MASIAKFLNPHDEETYHYLLDLRERQDENQRVMKQMDQKLEPPFVRRPAIPFTPHRDSRLPMNPALLTICMKQVILRHGGICHTETLAEFLHSFWPSCEQEDGTAFTLEDIKEEALETLRENTALFSETESGWILDPEEAKYENGEDVEIIPLVDKITAIIEDDEGSSTFESIAKRIAEEWTVPVYRGVQDSAAEVREAVSTILETNPKFYYDNKNPERYCVPLSRKRTRRPSGNTPSSKRRREDLTPDSDQEMGEGPPLDYVCACGATTPGKTGTAKWRLGTNGQYQCITCYSKSKQRGAIRGGGAKPKKKKSSATSTPTQNNNSNKEDDDGPWIQCDRCSTWVRAHTDNIRDLSKYDDSNPNHLDYFCPDCRSKQAGDIKRKSARRRTPRREQS